MHGGGTPRVKIVKENLLGDRVEVLVRERQAAGTSIPSSRKAFPALELAASQVCGQVEKLSRGDW